MSSTESYQGGINAQKLRDHKVMGGVPQHKKTEAERLEYNREHTNMYVTEWEDKINTHPGQTSEDRYKLLSAAALGAAAEPQVAQCRKSQMDINQDHSKEQRRNKEKLLSLSGKLATIRDFTGTVSLLTGDLVVMLTMPNGAFKTWLVESLDESEILA